MRRSPCFSIGSRFSRRRCDCSPSSPPVRQARDCDGGDPRRRAPSSRLRAHCRAGNRDRPKFAQALSGRITKSASHRPCRYVIVAARKDGRGDRSRSDAATIVSRAKFSAWIRHEPPPPSFHSGGDRPDRRDRRGARRHAADSGGARRGRRARRSGGLALRSLRPGQSSHLRDRSARLGRRTDRRCRSAMSNSSTLSATAAATAAPAAVTPMSFLSAISPSPALATPRRPPPRAPAFANGIASSPGRTGARADRR